MSLLPRALQKIFGQTGGTSEFGQIGSKAAGSPVSTKNLETMQNLTEYLQGMGAIISDEGTTVLPYMEDMNSLFFLATSQLAYLMQSGIPEWNDETEYYQDLSFVLDEGVIWKDIYGTVGTPNLNYQPSTNQDKWEFVCASFAKQTILASGPLVLGWSHHKIEVDTSGGDINISVLPVPKFTGQKLHVYVNGANYCIIAAGTGVNNIISITENNGGAFFESVNFGGSLEWRVIKPSNNVFALTDAANISTDCSKGTVFTVTLAGNRTLDNPTNIIPGKSYTWKITQDATGGRGLIFGSYFKIIGHDWVDKRPNAITVLRGVAISTSEIRCEIDGNGRREYSVANGDLTITGAGWVTDYSSFIPYKIDGQWRLKFEFQGTVSTASRSLYSVTISGISFGGASYNAVNGAFLNSISSSQHDAPDTYTISPNSIYFRNEDRQTVNYMASGDVPLSGKPTWAD